jgi:hypothetical protein
VIVSASTGTKPLDLAIKETAAVYYLNELLVDGGVLFVSLFCM